MPINTSDIVQGKRTYKYSHAEEIIVCEKIWIRHIWIRDDPPNYWMSQHEENRLMDYEPTNRPASQFTGKQVERPRRKPKKSKPKLQATPPEAKPQPAPAKPKRERKPKPKLHPTKKSIRDLIRKFGEDTP